MTMIKKSKNCLQLLAVILIFCMRSTAGYATTAFDHEKANLYQGNKFAISVGLGVVKFNTNVKITDKQSSGFPMFINLEACFVPRNGRK